MGSRTYTSITDLATADNVERICYRFAVDAGFPQAADALETLLGLTGGFYELLADPAWRIAPRTAPPLTVSGVMTIVDVERGQVRILAIAVKERNRLYIAREEVEL